MSENISKPPASDIKSLIVNIAWWVWGHGFRMMATFFVGFWVIRHLGPASFGELCVIRAVQGILNVVATMGLAQSLPIQLAAADKSASKTLITAGIVRFGGAIVAAAISVPVLCWIRGYGPDDWHILLVASLILLVSPLEILESWFVAQTKSRFTVLSRMTSVAITAGLQVLMIFGGLSFAAFLTADLVAIGVYGGMLLFFASRYVRPEGRLQTDAATVNRLIRNNLPIWLAAAATMTSVRIDQAMLGVMLSEEATGLYATAARLSEFWFFIPGAIITSTIPSLTRQYENDKANYRRNVLKVSSVLTSSSVLIAMMMGTVATPLVVLLFGEEFRASGSVLMIHVWSLPFLALSYLSHNLRIMQGQQMSLLPRTIAGATVNIVLNCVFIPIYGINAAAISTLISYIAGGIGWDLIVDRSHGLGALQAKSFLPRHWITAASTVFARFRTAAAR